MFAVYKVGYDGSYNPFDGAIYGPFDTVDKAKEFCKKDNDSVPLKWTQDTFSKRVNLSAEGNSESCYLIQELTVDSSLDDVFDDDDDFYDDDYGPEDHGDN